MDTSIYTWQHLLFTADILVQKGCLNETQLALIIDLIDLRKLVKNNKLSNEFINKFLNKFINTVINKFWNLLIKL